jgi:5-hydroxyisourate hydrolase-like protein (transthyretin family)
MMPMQGFFMKTISFFLLTFFFCVSLSGQKIHKGEIHIFYSPGRPANAFIPSQSIGGDLDGHLKGDINRMLLPENIQAMQTVGLKLVSYRLRTELAGEVWHWNPKGTWSEKNKQQGYWISDSVSKEPIQISNGYRLPRRGNTFDQANNDGYSRIDDGDSVTFWKSNPYLDKYFTKESNDLHPQWVIVDLGKKYQVNALRIKWGNPYAETFRVDYAVDVDPDYFDPFQPDIWRPFSKDYFQNLDRENKIVKITDKNLRVRFIRISMTKSSYTSDEKSDDIRDRLGFAIKELEVGFMNSKGKFKDQVFHSPDHRQSVVYVSSTDSWHTSNDIDPNIEQTGIDRFFASGITGSQPALMPAALLYDTPENVLSMIKYLKTKNYLVDEFEMGEEPEGQLVSPVDYAALYYQLGVKIKVLDSAWRLGGPGFASISSTADDSSTFSESKWTALFLNYLKKHNGTYLFNFFTFEWYPFDNLCTQTASQLSIAPKKLSIALKNFQNILSQNTPIYLTEYGYSAYEGKPEVEIGGALMYADILGKFLESGGTKSFLYGYEPAYLEQSYKCSGYGNNILFGLAEDGKIKYKTAAYYGTKMITENWAKPSDSVLEIYPSSSNIHNRKKEPLISAYPLRSPNGKWSVMLINKDPKRTFNVDVDVENKVSKEISDLHFENLIQYSERQYHWIDEGLNSYPSKNLPPITKKINGSKNISLPPYSLTVVN